MIDDLDGNETLDKEKPAEAERNEDTPVVSGGLGLGLNALFEEGELDKTPSVQQIEQKIAKTSPEKAGRMMLGVAQLTPSRFQPRQHFDENTIIDLAESIKQYGVLQPLLVRRDDDTPDAYEIIAGERRWRAAQQAQIHEVPVIIMDIDGLEAFKIAMVENLQRENLNPMDEAEGYKRLIDDYGLTQEQLSHDLGRSRSHIANMTRLLGLPGVVRNQVGAGNLTMGHARALASAVEPAALVEAVIRRGLSVRDTEKLVAEQAGKLMDGAPVQKDEARKSKARDEGAHEKDADTRALEDDISNALGMRVWIDSEDGRSGKLSVEFCSLDQLDDLLHRLAHFPGSKQSG